MTTLIIIIIIIILFLYLQNYYIVIDHIVVSSKKLPPAFNGFTIVQISDLHGKVFGRDNKTLISKIKRAKPDMIVITGDLTDHQYYDERTMNSFISEITKIASTYYVTGNQEVSSRYLTKLIHSLESQNVKVLRNSSEIIERLGQCIRIAGIDDSGYADMNTTDLNRKIATQQLNSTLVNNKNEDYTILLTHRPEQFTLYTDFGIDLIFSGHAHGGQIRLPFVGGLYAPNQGFFPKYTSGKYVKENSTMIVSRGLGNGTMKQRIFNNPEVVVVTLLSR